MSRATPQMRHFAKRLIVYETKRDKSAETLTPAGFNICDKLRPELAKLMGSGGFHALLARSLALAQSEVPWLRSVHVKADGSLEGVEELPAQLGPDEFFKGRVVLLAQLLGLLVAFIGENLTLHLMRDAWPKVPLDDLNHVNGDKK